MIYLIRHPETVANREKKYLGRSESPITMLGERQSRKCIHELSTINFDLVISSPRERCLYLAKQIEKNGDVLIDERIQEYNFGIFENMTWQQLSHTYPIQFEDWISDDKDYIIENGESQNQFESRIESFCSFIKDIGEEKNIAVITHNGVITSSLCKLFQMDDKHKWNFRIDNGKIVKIEIHEGFAYMVI